MKTDIQFELLEDVDLRFFSVASQSKKDSAMIFGACALLSALGYVVVTSFDFDGEFLEILRAVLFDLPFVVASAFTGFLVGDWYIRDPRGGILEAIAAPFVVFLTAFFALVIFYSPFIGVSVWADDLGGYIYVAVHLMFIVPAAIAGTVFLHLKHNR